MLTGNFLHVETDDKSQDKIVELYNKWADDIKFSSRIDDNNKYWLELVDYCEDNVELTKKFFSDLVDDVGTSGHFIRVFFYILDDKDQIKPDGYVQHNILEEIYYTLFNGRKPRCLKTWDLMTDDWVEVKHSDRLKYVQVDGLLNGSIFTKPDEYESEEIEVKDIKAIPLTEKILLDSGWNCHNMGSDGVEYDGVGYLYLFAPRDGENTFVTFNGWATIHYVHELQHAMRVNGCVRELVIID